jgi:hypothetical protein
MFRQGVKAAKTVYKYPLSPWRLRGDNNLSL